MCTYTVAYSDTNSMQMRKILLYVVFDYELMLILYFCLFVSSMHRHVIDLTAAQ